MDWSSASLATVALSGQDAKSGRFAYYVCQSIMKRGKDACVTPRLNARRFEQMIVDKIRSNILTEKSITELVRAADEEMDGIKEHRERKEGLKDAAAHATAVLSRRRAYLDDVNTISAYAKDMKDSLKESELTERRSLIESFVRENTVIPGDVLIRYTVPMPGDSFLAGRASKKVALEASVRMNFPATRTSWIECQLRLRQQ